jgi:hypothetical protein
VRLEVNGHVAAENADANSIKYMVGDLHSETETTILLRDVEGVYLQANGVPKRGFSLYYINKLTGVEYASNNKSLKPRAVMRVLKHYLAGDVLWRVDIAWIPVTEAAIAQEKARAWRRSKPVLLGMIMLVVSYVPLLFATRFLLDALVFKPLCARVGLVVTSFSQGGGAENFGAYTPPTCGYSNGSSADLSTLIGDGAYLLNAVGGVLVVIVPFLVLLALLYALYRYRLLATARQPAE